MKYLILGIMIVYSCFAKAQVKLKAYPIKLPSNVSYYNNQYSSLYISNQKLYLMSESRLEDKASAFLTSVNLSDLERAIKDSSFQPTFIKNPIHGLDVLRKKMKAENQSYEGLEATVINNVTVYLSVETATPSDYCYLLKGYFVGNDIYMDTTKMLRLAKPKDTAGKNVYNAGFESLELTGNRLYAFFEYNYFDKENNVISVDTSLQESSLQKISLEKMPFRITDITKSCKRNHLTGINYFYKGGGGDAVYRVPKNDNANYTLTRDSSGYRSYCRLVDIKFHKQHVTWKTLTALPKEYWAYNWEGLALYKKGFFIINDVFTPTRPYRTNLMYLKIEK
ncbi:hypothetical protein A9P82_08970 [Arachidicoccus ginsenosidimutans]|uniref:hypothetical protein n=1 Tax=Arachidicoccus sp. BS20 TaxID=1850526 RepID=UPI0007F09050|nr:hypothetical protein [Arachidicoccus sp. BS20]ANI89415.1 hypothetical protein A9P82_08970 [Arachidicoccus sp. BS20]